MNSFTKSIEIGLEQSDIVYDRGLEGGKLLAVNALYLEIQDNKYTTIKQVTDAIERIRRELIIGEQK